MPQPERAGGIIDAQLTVPAMNCLLIEDDVETYTFLREALAADGYSVTWCGNAADAVKLTTGRDWDVIVLDRMLPGEMDGLAFLAGLRERSPNVPVLVLSALASVDERVCGLRAGGDDYLAKPFALAELLARLNNLRRRASRVEESPTLCVGDLEVDTSTMRVTRAGVRLNLNARELRLLEYLMRHEGKVVTRPMLLEGVWDYHFDPQTNVIDVQISRLRSKIDKDAAAPLIHTVRGEGYMLKASGL